MKNIIAALGIAMFIASPVAMAQNSGNAGSSAVASGGAAGAGAAATAGYATLAVLSSVAIIGGAIAVANSGSDNEQDVDLDGAGGTTGTQ